MKGNLTIIVIVALIILAIWICMSQSNGESFAPERGSVMYSLGDNAYSRYQLPDYSENVDYNIDSKENYHPNTLCKMQCRYETGQKQRSVCIDQCMNQLTGLNQRVSCSCDNDCPQGDICVLGGAYSGIPHKGECMDPREPFKFTETGSIDNSPKTCSPSEFFSAYSGKCEPRFQGSSSAWAVNHQPQPEHPEVWIPGSTTPCYGVGHTDPFDVKTNVTIY